MTQYCELRDEAICIGEAAMRASRCVTNKPATRLGSLSAGKSLSEVFERFSGPKKYSKRNKKAMSNWMERYGTLQTDVRTHARADGRTDAPRAAVPPHMEKWPKAFLCINAQLRTYVCMYVCLCVLDLSTSEYKSSSSNCLPQKTSSNKYGICVNIN